MKHLRYALIAFGLLFASQADAATCFWVGGTGTWSTSNTASWASSTGGTAGTCAATGGIPKQAADTATFDGSSGGGTVTVDSTINGVTLTQITMGAFTGTLDFSVNNPSITLNIFSVTGSGTRTLKLGSGTFTLVGSSGTGSIWDASTTTGLTLNAGTSTISIGATACFVINHTFVGGGLTYSTLSVSGGTVTGCPLNITGNNTFTNLNITGPIVLGINTGTTQTITNATWTGTSSGLISLSQNLTGSGVGTISAASGTITCNWCAIANMTFSGGATFKGSNSFSIGNNTGITVSGPSVGGGHIIGG